MTLLCTADDTATVQLAQGTRDAKFKTHPNIDKAPLRAASGTGLKNSQPSLPQPVRPLFAAELLQLSTSCTELQVMCPKLLVSLIPKCKLYYGKFFLDSSQKPHQIWGSRHSCLPSCLLPQMPPIRAPAEV
jgi:hypothetical protein